MRYRSPIAALLLSVTLSAALASGCVVAPGQWPNCRKNSRGDVTLDESGWLCEGLDSVQCCGKTSTKRWEDGPFCAVNETGADIRMGRLHPNRINGTTVCIPVQAGSGDINGVDDMLAVIANSPPREPQDWDAPACSMCLTSCGSVACYQDSLCACYLQCSVKGGHPSMGECDHCLSLSGDPATWQAFASCTAPNCTAPCSAPAANDECSATCK